MMLIFALFIAVPSIGTQGSDYTRSSARHTAAQARRMSSRRRECRVEPGPGARARCAYLERVAEQMARERELRPVPATRPPRP